MGLFHGLSAANGRRYVPAAVSAGWTSTALADNGTPGSRPYGTPTSATTAERVRASRATQPAEKRRDALLAPGAASLSSVLTAWQPTADKSDFAWWDPDV